MVARLAAPSADAAPAPASPASRRVAPRRQEILRWESLHPECLEKVRLLRFQGNPHEVTPKAWLHQQFGYKPPFDRHDWVVERCGREVRYLIDFYQGRASAGHAVSVHIDARPAADSLPGVWDRVRMAWRSALSS